MNSNVHPVVVALVLVLTGIAIGTWMWGSGAAAMIGGPAELKMNSAGHVYVQIQDSLIEHDSNGTFLKTHNLRDMGVDTFLGSFAFFSNGDILLRRGPDPRSVADDVRAFQRLTNEQSIEPESRDSGMFRCELETKVCDRFGQAGIDFKAAHGIFIDWKTDEVYISDTTRHVLRKYSSDGVALAGPASGFKFPNQLLMHDGQLLVADTNHHEIRVVDPMTETFAEELGKYSVAPALATAAEQTWPSHFVRVGDGWWVNNMRTGMNYGGIYLFDNNWRLNRKLDLPDGADPIAMVAFGDEVWISDWYNDKVYRFSISGEPLSDLDSAGLEDILRVARTERWKFEVISYSGIALILLILAGLALRGFAVGMSKDSPKTGIADGAEEAASPDADVYLEPDNKTLVLLGWALRLFVLMMIVFAALIAYLIVFHSKPEVGFAFILPGLGMLLLVVLISWIHRANIGTSIRVEGGIVTLKDRSGRESSCLIGQVRYDDSAIATHDSVIFLGRAPASIYKRKDLTEKLFPLFDDSQKVSPMQMQKILIEHRHPQGVMAVIAIVGILMYGAWAVVS